MTPQPRPQLGPQARDRQNLVTDSMRAPVAPVTFGGLPMERGTVLDAHASVPSRLVHQSFVATPLTTDNFALDYAAYMASPDVIRVHSDGRWQVDGFTLDQDRAQVAIHEADHKAHRAFTFLLLDPAESESLGCLYVNPLLAYLRRVDADPQTLSTFPPASAMVTFWIRQDRQHVGLAAVVAEAVNTWLMTAWPLETHLFRVLPGERTSVAALERLPVERVPLQLPGEERPYIWCQPT